MKKLGFTLVELLVVITIMAIVGVFAFANLRSFGEDKKLQNSAVDLQSLLKVAQTNATTGLKCGTTASAIWLVEFKDAVTLDLKCQVPPAAAVIIKSLTLKGAEIQTIQTAKSCQVQLPLRVIYNNIFGYATFEYAIGGGCIGDTSAVIVKLQTMENAISNVTINVTITKGGAISIE